MHTLSAHMYLCLGWDYILVGHPILRQKKQCVSAPNSITDQLHNALWENTWFPSQSHKPERFSEAIAMPITSPGHA